MTQVYTDATITVDTYLDDYVPTYNYGVATLLKVSAYESSTEKQRALLRVDMPSKPSNATGEPSVRLRINVYAATIADAKLVQVWKMSPNWSTILEGTGNGSATGDGATWNTYNGTNNWSTSGGDYQEFLAQKSITTTGWHEIELPELGLSWGDKCWIVLRMNSESLTGQNTVAFYSAEGTNPPVVRCYYEDDEPEPIDDLAVSAGDSDPTKVKLTWSANKDADFVSYKIRKSTSSPVTGSSTLVATLTNQAETSYTEASANTENQVNYYAVFVEDANNTGTLATKSNEVWAVRPDVSSFVISDYAPDLFEEVTGTITPATYTGPAAALENTLFEYRWGGISGDDTSSGSSESSTRAHRFPYSGTHRSSCRITNALGLASDWTACGSDIDVQNANPIGRIRASPMIAKTNQTVYFYADESFCPAGNKGFYATNPYKWDKDYDKVTFVDDYTTQLPVFSTSWATAGTKCVALQVKDENARMSSTVYIEVEVVAQSTVDLENLADGYEVIRISHGRQGAVLDGPESYEIASAGETPRSVFISGFAYTDSDSDGVPDDIETLMDAASNNKAVSLTVEGTTRTGIILGDIERDTEGSFDKKYNWNCRLVLE